MEVVVSYDVPAQLQAPDAFGRFAVRPGLGLGLEQALEGITRVEGGPHAWVLPQTIHGLAARANDRAWNDGVDTIMLAFAADRGWLASDGAIHGHIDVQEG